MKKDKIQVAKGIQPADIVLKGGTVLNVFSEEFIIADVAIVGDCIVGVGEYRGDREIDCSGKYITASFIDAHMHIESSMITPLELAKKLVVKGTTTLIADPHEIVNVAGKVGLDYMLDAIEQPLVDIYLMMPSSVPAVDIDTNGAGAFSVNNMKEYIDNDKILGLGEVMRFYDVLNSEQAMLEKLRLFKGKHIDGHAPAISTKEIAAYRSAGVLSDHECESAQEALEKLRAGYYVMIREGSGAHNLEAIITGLLQENVSFEQCLFCTDDKHLKDIDEEGHINHCVRKAILLGVPLITAYKMASYYPAKAFGLRNVGAIGAGYKADLLVFSSLEEVQPEKIMKNGTWMDLEEIQSYCDNTKITSALCNTISVKTITKKDLVVKKYTKNQVMELIPYSLLTKLRNEEVPGDAMFVANDTYAKLCVIERYGKTAGVSACPVKGFGIKGGAIASSVSHDAHNIVVIGDNDQDIIAAVAE
ncbi:MAG: adenine deaminase, partial [Breznakia sp.]